VNARRSHLAVQHTLAWLPLLFFAYERLTNSHSWRNICLVALALSLQFYAGFIQIWLYSVSALGLYALYSLRRYPNKRLWLKEIALFGSLTPALVAAQAIPTVITAVGTGRMSIPYDAFVSYSFPVKHLRTLINPFFFGLAIPGTPFQFFSRPYSGAENVTELACYAGAISLIAILALAFMKGRPRGTLFWMGLGCMALLLSMGRYFPWFAKVLFQIPAFNSFKVQSRFLFLFDFSAAVLVALCLSAIERKDFNARALKLGLRLYCVLAIAVTLSGLRWGYPYSVGPELWITPIVAVAFLLTVECLAGRPRHLSLFKAVLGALVALDLWSFAFFNTNIFITMKPPESSLATVIRRLDPGGDYRILTAVGVNDDSWYGGVGHDHNMRQGIRALTGYTTFVPATFLEALRSDELGRLYDYGYLARNRDLLSALNTKWIIINNQDRTDRRWRALADAFGEPLTFEDHDIFTNPDAMRRVFAAARVMHAPNDIIDGHNYRESAVVPDSIPEQQFEHAVSVTDIRATHGRIGATTRSAGPSYVVFSETYLRGWTARVDGEPVELVKTNGLWMGVQVPPGDHRVEIMFEPGWFYFGFAVSGVTLLGVLGILITGRGKRRLDGLEPPQAARGST
jgi:hypothetical protein